MSARPGRGAHGPMVTSGMAHHHVPAGVRLAITRWPDDAARGAVTRFCDCHGISRAVFYKIRHRAHELGPAAALVPRSRRPRHVPARTEVAVIAVALRLRARLEEQGLEAGPGSVRRAMLGTETPPPSRATLARAFAAAGVSRCEPRKRPRSADRRTSTGGCGPGVRDACLPSPAGERTPIALYPPTGATTLTVHRNGQVRVLGCVFYITPRRAGQQVHVSWTATTVQIVTDDAEVITYPRPSTTGVYFGPRGSRSGTPLTTMRQSPAAGITGSAHRTVAVGGYIGILANKFCVGAHRHGEQVTVTWDAASVTIADAKGSTIARYARPTKRGGRHTHTVAEVSTKS